MKEEQQLLNHLPVNQWKSVSEIGYSLALTLRILTAHNFVRKKTLSVITNSNYWSRGDLTGFEETLNLTKTIALHIGEPYCILSPFTQTESGK